MFSRTTIHAKNLTTIVNFKKFTKNTGIFINNIINFYIFIY